MPFNLSKDTIINYGQPLRSRGIIVLMFREAFKLSLSLPLPISLSLSLPPLSIPPTLLSLSPPSLSPSLSLCWVAEERASSHRPTDITNPLAMHYRQLLSGLVSVCGWDVVSCDHFDEYPGSSFPELCNWSVQLDWKVRSLCHFCKVTCL